MQPTRTDLQIPEFGIPAEDLLNELDQRSTKDIKWKDGRVFSLVYYLDEDHLALLNKAYQRFFSENMLNPYAFDSLRTMEKEILSMAINLLNGNEQTVGVMTSGGTESIFQAVYTYREWARKHKKHIQQPEMVVPLSIHPAFEKAAHLLNIKMHKIPAKSDYTVDVEAMRKAINKNTIFLAASAPVYPHGVMDPIEEVAALAKEFKLPMHVDACIGGYMLPWVEKLAYPVPNWDFRVDGVTSISADLHKFGYAAKGASTLLYSSMNYMKYQFFIATEWPGGIYASSSLLGSRSGGPISAAWVALKSLGQEGYLRIAKELMEGVEYFKRELEAIPEISILGKPTMNIISYMTKGNKPDIFVIADQLEEKGWLVDRQQFPNSIHLTVMRQHLQAMDLYLSDLKEAIEFAKNNPGAQSKGNAALYGLMARIPFRGMVKSNVRKLFEEMYGNPTAQLEQEEEEHSNSPSDSAPFWAGPLNRVLSFLSKK
ncbi:MAG: aspartate aminotransferase family protein [Bacteroidota bacterium]